MFLWSFPDWALAEGIQNMIQCISIGLEQVWFETQLWATQAKLPAQLLLIRILLLIW